MKKSDKISYRQKGIEELGKLHLELKKKLVETRAQFYTGNLKDTSVFKKIKHEIALVKTLISESLNSKNDK